MEKEILFEERQRFLQWWLLLILAVSNGLFVYGIVQQVYLGEMFGDKPMSNAGLVLACALVLLITFMILSVRLDTRINADGIYVRFFPFHLMGYKFYSWNEIEKAYVRQYNPIGEYGGWGIRLGIFGSGRALNISGNKGIQLEMKNGKKLLIGTKRYEDAEKALQTLGQKSNG